MWQRLSQMFAAQKLAPQCFSPVCLPEVFPMFYGAHGAVSGTTRDNFAGKPVKELRYTAYVPLALKTMNNIAKSVKAKYDLTAVSMVHRLGICPIGEESILIAVSAPHRQVAWKGGEEVLEECKNKAEIWKMEEFGGEDGGVWRANRDGRPGVNIQHESNQC